jgi:hypothetical protein
MCNETDRRPTQPSDLEKLRFEYAWKWFNFHAEQRTRMFNYLLIGMGIFGTALVAAIDKHLVLEAVTIGTAAMVVAIVFYLLDRRNRQLYIVAMDVLIHLEQKWIFADDTDFTDHDGKARHFGISGRVAVEDRALAKKSLAPLHGALAGQHRLWMPFIVLAFAALFGAAAMREWLFYSGAVPRGLVTIAGMLVLAASVASAWSALRAQRKSPLALLGIAFGVSVVAVGQLSERLSRPLEMRPDIQIELKADLEGPVQATIRPTPAVRIGIVASGIFEGYASGSPEVDCGTPANSLVAAKMKQALTEIRQRKERALLLLVGSTDRRPMIPATLVRFGSSEGLARGRTDAALKCLRLPAEDLREIDVIHLAAGPGYTPSAAPAAVSVPASALAGDRIVRASIVAFR